MIIDLLFLCFWGFGSGTCLGLKNKDENTALDVFVLLIFSLTLWPVLLGISFGYFLDTPWPSINITRTNQRE